MKERERRQQESTIGDILATNPPPSNGTPRYVFRQL